MTASRLKSTDLLVAGIVILAAVSTGCGRPKVRTASVTGTVTINGRGVANVEVAFCPVEKTRPAFGVTDSAGRYSAQFLNNQSGVPLGKCVVRIAYRPNGGPFSILPEKYDAGADDDPALHLTVPSEGTTFDFDVTTDRPLP